MRLARLQVNFSVPATIPFTVDSGAYNRFAASYWLNLIGIK